MARAAGQKLKLLYLKDYLEQNSDEAHPVPMPELLQMLERHGVRAERKSVYDDLELLREFGMDILRRPGRGGGYYLASRSFELPELKLLVDAVQASKFLSAAKSRSLIHKLEGLCSRFEAQHLNRQVVVSGRVKTMNESIYYNVDALHEAIARDRQVQFQYLEWDLRKRRVPRRGGQIYQASPWALAWENANYYLVAYTGEGIRHYRVDKMKGVRQTELPRQGKAEFSALDLAAYTRKMFGMYGGREEKVTLKCANSLVGVMLDRFGTEAILVPQADETFHLTVPVAVSPQFLGWVCGFGGEVRVIGPAAVRREMGRLVQSLADTYLPLQE